MKPRTPPSQRLLILPLALLLPLLAACGGTASSGPVSERKINAVATIGQIADIVGVVGGDRVEVVPLMGAGVDPHLYKASEGDIARLTDADIVFYNGLHLEGKMGEILEKLGEERPVVAVTDRIPETDLRSPPEFDGNHDPHVWFDPTLWGMAVDRVRDALSEVDPASGETFAANAAAYHLELDALDAYAAEQLASIPEERRVLVTAHDAFGYFGDRYDTEVVGLQGISTDTEAGIDDVERVARMIAERQIKAIFVETSVPRRTVEAVQLAVRDAGGEVFIGDPLYSDALGDQGGPGGTYLGMVRSNVDAIVAALR